MHGESRIEEFIKSCNRHEHYAYIQPRPAQYAAWRGNHNLTVEYSEWVWKQSNCPSLKLNIPVPALDILEEALTNLSRFVSHRDNEGNSGWLSATIHGVDTHITNSWNYYNFESEPTHTWTALADSCPKTKAWLESFPCTAYQRVRFMCLAPGGVIALHRDNTERGLDAINVAINNPANCNFYMEDAGTIPWRVGDVRLIDIGRYHAVVNNSDAPRIHMIIHGGWNMEILKQTCESYDELSRLHFQH